MKENDSRKWVKVRTDPGAGQVRAVDGGIEIKRSKGPISSKARDIGTVYLAIDCSASMSGEKLAHAKQGGIDFAKEARNKGYCTGLITFDSYATHLCSPQQEISVLREALDPVVVAGSTNMTHAITLAAEKLSKAEGKRALVIVTDGMPDNRNAALAAALRATSEGIDIIALGTGDADHEFLKKLASRNDLATVVHQHQLRDGIAATAQMLPRGK
jgi:molecular chaperone DnaK